MFLKVEQSRPLLGIGWPNTWANHYTNDYFFTLFKRPQVYVAVLTFDPTSFYLLLYSHAPNCFHDNYINKQSIWILVSARMKKKRKTSCRDCERDEGRQKKRNEQDRARREAKRTFANLERKKKVLKKWDEAELFVDITACRHRSSMHNIHSASQCNTDIYYVKYPQAYRWSLFLTLDPHVCMPQPLLKKIIWSLVSARFYHQDV